MQSDQETNYLNDKSACQHEEIYKLKEKLVTYNEVNDKKKQLESQLNELKKWVEDVKYKDNQMIYDIKNNYDIQTEKLRKAEEFICKLQTENKKLLDVNECITKQLNMIKKREQKILIEIEDSKICQNRLKDDLHYAKADGEDKRCTIENLTKSLMCKENECFDIHCKLIEYKTISDQQNEAIKNLKSEVECINEELAATKSRKTLTEQKLKVEKDTLSNELEIKNHKFHVMEIEYNHNKRIIDDEKLKTKKLDNLIVKLKETNKKNVQDMNTMIQKLKEENCTKENNLHCMEDKFEEQQQVNKCMASEIKLLKKQLIAHQCLLEKMKQSAEIVKKQNNTMCEKFEKDLNSGKCDVQQKINKVEVLERQVCELKNKIKELQLQKCPGPANSCLPSLSSKHSTPISQDKQCTNCPKVNSCISSPLCK